MENGNSRNEENILDETTDISIKNEILNNIVNSKIESLKITKTKNTLEQNKFNLENENVNLLNKNNDLENSNKNFINEAENKNKLEDVNKDLKTKIIKNYQNIINLESQNKNLESENKKLNEKVFIWTNENSYNIEIITDLY